MQEILQELGNLFLGAVPTAALFTVLVLCYQFLVQRPLTATLKERTARTDGAVEAAEQAIARAEARAAEYAEKLRAARHDVFKSREARLKQLMGERDAALEVARKASSQKVGEVRADIEAQVVQARQTIEASAAELAAQVVRTVLPQAAGGLR